MRVGLFAPLVTPTADRTYLAALAAGAEELGFSAIWTGEHLVTIDDDPSPYPYSADGKMPAVGPANGLPEPFTTLAFLAAHTERVRLGTGLALLPIRHPVQTAKEASNLDWLCGGRFDLGVGLGWSAAEYAAMGVPWERRGARSRAYLEVLTTLWRDEVSSCRNEFYDLPPCRMYPKPVQPGGVPIYLGGDSPATFRRLAEFGQGYYGFDHTPADVAERLAAIEPELAKRDRSRSDIVVQVCPYTKPVGPDELGRYHDAGVDQVLLTVIGDDVDQLRRRLERAAPLVEVGLALGAGP